MFTISYRWKNIFINSSAYFRGRGGFSIPNILTQGHHRDRAMPTFTTSSLGSFRFAVTGFEAGEDCYYRGSPLYSWVYFRSILLHTSDYRRTSTHIAPSAFSTLLQRKTPPFQQNGGVIVEMRGIEPRSGGRPLELLRAQSANDFLGLTHSHRQDV